MLNDKRLMVQIKGVKDGLLVTLGEGDWPELQAALYRQIAEQETFFKGARLMLDVGNQILRVTDMSSLRDTLSDHGISLWAVLSNSPTTEQTAQMLGLATRLPAPRPDRTMRKLDTNLASSENAVLMQRTLRSGFKVSHQGHVVIIGDVNPGAEIIATGSVVVWGRLRGVVQAGAEGDASAVVCALDLAPTQLRIAGQIAVTPQHKGKPQPEMVSVRNGQVVAEPWTTR